MVEMMGVRDGKWAASLDKLMGEQSVDLMVALMVALMVEMMAD